MVLTLVRFVCLNDSYNSITEVEGLTKRRRAYGPDNVSGRLGWLAHRPACRRCTDDWPLPPRFRRKICFVQKHTLIIIAIHLNNKKAVLPQGNRAMPQVFFFGWSSPTTFLTSIRLAICFESHASELQTCWHKTQFNIKSGFKVIQSHVFGVSGKAVRQ